MAVRATYPNVVDSVLDARKKELEKEIFARRVITGTKTPVAVIYNDGEMAITMDVAAQLGKYEVTYGLYISDTEYGGVIKIRGMAGNNIAGMSSSAVDKLVSSYPQFEAQILLAANLASRYANDRRNGTLPNPLSAQSNSPVVGTKSVEPKFVRFFSEAMEKLGLAKEQVMIVDARDAQDFVVNHAFEDARLDSVFLYAALTARDKSDTENGFMYRGPNNQNILFANVRENQKNFNELYIEIVSHEYGHLIARTQLDQLRQNDPKTYEAMLDAYQAWYKKFSNPNLKFTVLANSLRNRFFAAATIAGMKDKNATLADISPSVLQYLLGDGSRGFGNLAGSEWFADNVGRWFTTDRRPLTALEKFWKSLADNLKALARMVTGSPDYKPDATIKEWLDGMWDANTLRNQVTPIQFEGQIDELTPTTKSFKRWFGSSKVVDSNGEPLVVYHTGAFDDSVIKSAAAISGRGGNNGIYFTKDPQYSAAYSGGNTQYKSGTAMYPVYLSLQNPLILNDDSRVSLDSDARADAEINGLRQKLKSMFQKRKEKTPTKTYDSTSSFFIDDDFMAKLKAAGYDGIINNAWNEIVVFDSNQIKSATGNNGDFDPSNDRIDRLEKVGADESNAADRFFEDSLLEDTRPDYKSREKIVYMSVDDFLNLSDNLDREYKSQARDAAGEGKKWKSLPLLLLGEVSPTTRIVEGHEGRHRALYLKEQGIKTMPVRVRDPFIRWSEQDDSNKFDYVEELPTELKAQNKASDPSFTIPFPVNSREDATSGSVRSGQDRIDRLEKVDRQSTTDTPEFKRWFGDSQVVDADGEPLVLYRGAVGMPLSEGFLNAEPREGYAVFASSNPYVANTYAQPDSDENLEGAVTPLYIKATRLIEFPTQVNRYGNKTFDMFEFDRRAQALSVGEVLVVRGVRDTGPRASLKTDPTRQWSYPSDIYAWNKGTSVKSATGNNGDFDPSNDRIDRLSPISINSQSQAADSDATQALKSISGLVADHIKSFGKTLLNGGTFLSDVVERAGKQGLTSARDYFETLNQRAAMKREYTQKIDRILGQFKRLSADEQPTVDDVLFRSSLIQAYPYAPEFKGGEALQAKLVAALTPEQAAELKELQQTYSQLSDAAQKVVRDVFAFGKESMALKRDLLEAKVDDMFAKRLNDVTGDIIKTAKLVKEKEVFLKQFRNQLDGPYVPFKRFGNFVAVFKSAEFVEAELQDNSKKLAELKDKPEHYMVEFAPTEAAAERISQKWQEQSPDAETYFSERRFVMNKLAKIDRTFSQELINAVEAGLDKNTAEEVGGIIRDIYLRNLADNHARKSEMRRRNIGGASRDIMRAFVSQGLADSHYIAALKYNDDLNQSLIDLTNEMRIAPDKAAASRLANEILRRHQLGLTYQDTPIQDQIAGTTAYWTLLTSPSHLLINGTQPWMVSVPYMGAKYGGFNKASKALYAAYKEVYKATDGGKVDITKLGKDANERAMLQQLKTAGLLDILLDHDLGAVAKDSFGAKVLGNNKVLNKLREMPSVIEQYNRATTALATYRLHMENAPVGLRNRGDATAAALRSVEETQGNYSYENAPRFFNQMPFGKVLLQFRKYQIIMGSLIAKNMYNALKGASPEEKAQARAMVGYLMGMQLTFAGVAGLPLVGFVSAVINAMFGDDDEPWDYNTALRKSMSDTFGKDVGMLVAKGLPTALGLDLSSRISFADIFDPARYTRDVAGGRAQYLETVISLAGPFLGGVVPRAADGVSMMVGGDYWKGAEMMLPKGLADVMKAIRIKSEGITTRSGETALDADKIGMDDFFEQALGLTPSVLSERTAAQSSQIKGDTFYKERGAAIKKSYMEAVNDKDMQAAGEARREWIALQQKRKELGFGYSPLSDLVKAPQQRAKRERGYNEQGIYIGPKRTNEYFDYAEVE